MVLPGVLRGLPATSARNSTNETDHVETCRPLGWVLFGCAVSVGAGPAWRCRSRGYDYEIIVKALTAPSDTREVFFTRKDIAPV